MTLPGLLARLAAWGAMFAGAYYVQRGITAGDGMEVLIAATVTLASLAGLIALSKAVDGDHGNPFSKRFEEWQERHPPD